MCACDTQTHAVGKRTGEGDGIWTGCSLSQLTYPAINGQDTEAAHYLFVHCVHYIVLFEHIKSIKNENKLMETVNDALKKFNCK